MESLLKCSDLLLTFAIAMVVAHFLMYFLSRHPRWHRGVVYAAGLTGSISLLASLYLANEVLARQALPAAERFRAVQLELLVEGVQSQKRFYCENVFARTEYSPPDFDEIVADHARACETFSNIYERSDAWDDYSSDVELSELNNDALRRPPEAEVRDRLLDRVEELNRASLEVRELKTIVNDEPSWFDLLLATYGHIFLISAFSVGLAVILFPARKQGHPDE